MICIWLDILWVLHAVKFFICPKAVTMVIDWLYACLVVYLHINWNLQPQSLIEKLSSFRGWSPVDQVPFIKRFTLSLRILLPHIRSSHPTDLCMHHACVPRYSRVFPISDSVCTACRKFPLFTEEQMQWDVLPDTQHWKVVGHDSVLGAIQWEAKMCTTRWEIHVDLTLYPVVLSDILLYLFVFLFVCLSS